jgi:hypothetical protein
MNTFKRLEWYPNELYTQNQLIEINSNNSLKQCSEDIIDIKCEYLQNDITPKKTKYNLKGDIIGMNEKWIITTGPHKHCNGEGEQEGDFFSENWIDIDGKRRTDSYGTSKKYVYSTSDLKTVYFTFLSYDTKVHFYDDLIITKRPVGNAGSHLPAFIRVNIPNKSIEHFKNIIKTPIYTSKTTFYKDIMIFDSGKILEMYKNLKLIRTIKYKDLKRQSAGDLQDYYKDETNILIDDNWVILVSRYHGENYVTNKGVTIFVHNINKNKTEWFQFKGYVGLCRNINIYKDKIYILYDLKWAIKDSDYTQCVATFDLITKEYSKHKTNIPTPEYGLIVYQIISNTPLYVIGLEDKKHRDKYDNYKYIIVIYNIVNDKIYKFKNKKFEMINMSKICINNTIYDYGKLI